MPLFDEIAVGTVVGFLVGVLVGASVGVLVGVLVGAWVGSTQSQPISAASVGAREKNDRKKSVPS